MQWIMVSVGANSIVLLSIKNHTSVLLVFMDMGRVTCREPCAGTLTRMIESIDMEVWEHHAPNIGVMYVHNHQRIVHNILRFAVFWCS